MELFQRASRLDNRLVTVDFLFEGNLFVAPNGEEFHTSECCLFKNIALLSWEGYALDGDRKGCG